jgi:hypothetical protein
MIIFINKWRKKPFFSPARDERVDREQRPSRLQNQPALLLHTFFPTGLSRACLGKIGVLKCETWDKRNRFLTARRPISAAIIRSTKELWL